MEHEYPSLWHQQQAEEQQQQERQQPQPKPQQPARPQFRSDLKDAKAKSDFIGKFGLPAFEALPRQDSNTIADLNDKPRTVHGTFIDYRAIERQRAINPNLR